MYIVYSMSLHTYINIYIYLAFGTIVCVYIYIVYIHTYTLVYNKLLKEVKQSDQGSVQFSPVTQSCLTLCNPMNRSMPGLPVHHQSPEFTHPMSIESVMPSSHLILCRPLLLLPQSLPALESFPMSQLFAWGGQSTGVSALASFLPKKSQGWSPSEWTGWISLQYIW